MPATGSYINAKVDGKSFTTVNFGVSSAATSSGGSGSSRYILISGTSVDLTQTKTIVISLVGITATGTYTLSKTSNIESLLSYATSTLTGEQQVAYSTGDCTEAKGSIKITTYDATKVEGNFSFTGSKEGCNETKEITNGSFRGEFSEK